MKVTGMKILEWSDLQIRELKWARIRREGRIVRSTKDDDVEEGEEY
jgi:hypothetical protein